ncbi:glutathione S-transferase [Xylophilus sp. Leaf220]|uniref:glutathione S-transferase n=1 Tax=Xylophilus sp. Leaf220 TaxID=1735686 RepID=UPI000A430F5B
MELNAQPLPVLYSFRRCPYAMRARAALLSGGVQCELREVVLRDKPAALWAASPKGTVPVLVLADGRVIDQSLAIMRWALERHDPARWLQPACGSLDAVWALVDACDAVFKPALDAFKYPNRPTDLPAGTDARGVGAAWLQTLEERLRTAPHLFGDRPCLADAAILPFVRQFAMVAPDGFAAEPWPHLHAWLAEWSGSAAFVRTMHRYPPWDGRPGTAWFPPAG